MTVLHFSRSVIILYFKLFRFATQFEKAAIIFGVLLSILSAFGVPFGVIIYGEFTALLVDRHVRKRNSTQVRILEYFGGGEQLYNGTVAENRDALINDSKAFLFSNIIIGLYVLVLGTISIDIINHMAVKQIGRIRKLFFESILRQEIGWFDTNKEHNFAVRVTDDLEKWKDGIGEKLSIFIYLVTMFIVSVIFSFSYGWKLTLVILCCAPVIILSTSIISRVQTRLSKNEVESYSNAGSVAEEVLRAIRTVVVFSGEDKELKRYSKQLKIAEDSGIKKGLYSGFGSGLMWCISYSCYALAFWYGIQLILNDRDNFEKEYTPAVLIIVLFGIVTGAQNLGFTTPHLEAFYSAYSAASAIFSVVDRKSKIDSLSDDGIKPKLISGGITFKNVCFSYPSRRSVNVLDSFTLNIKAGERVALVGSSGCGKSTILQLIERFYDPTSGIIYLDGSDIRTISVKALRCSMGHVGQEPVLFSTSIAENIRYGKLDATNDEIEAAARIAHCHDFIKSLPEGYNTLVGERGNQLSGGQKQRIAIARAIVKNPKILLLDEATSALDQTSEIQVQKALDNASKGRTTIVVAHRLSTVVNANRIGYIENGELKEIGSHTELMRQQGLYYQMVQSNKQVKSESANIESDNSVHTISQNNRTFVDADIVATELETETHIKQTQPDEKLKASWRRIISFNSPEWLHLSFGCIASSICGIHLPIYAIIFAEIFGIFALDDPAEVSKYSVIYSLCIFVIGIVVGVATFAQIYLFTYSGVRLTSRLRTETFKSMMRQEIGWFDETKNSVGALCVRLASDASNVQGATGSRLGTMFQCFSMIGLGLIIAFYYSWSLTLVSLISSLLVILAVYVENRYIERSSLNEKICMENATRIAIESISNIRTVASLCHEREVLNQYIKECEEIEKAGHQKSRLRGVVFSFGQAAPCMAFGLALWYGGILVAKYDLPYINMIKVSEALIFGSWMLGQSLAHTPNFTGAKISAGRLLEIIDRKSKIIKHSRSISTSERFQGNIKFDGVKFNYPTRPDIEILKEFNLNIESGKNIALVGASGCGKSTSIQLLLRYYDPVMGTINLDYIPTVEYSLETLRHNFGIVAQEPILFDRTIAENIAYGNNERDMHENEIIEVAKIANIHKFITKLPLGYDTEIGKLGGQLSGGQKQRIAIARAIIRNPSILLLDEATSALDSQNEKIVQATLDNVKNGRTCITIAHRLSTIQNADLICVIENGRIVECGTHNELLALDQLYSQLYTLQRVE